MPQLYNDNVGEVLRKYSADTSVTVNAGESNVSATGVQQIVAGVNITLDPPDGQGIVTINASGLISPWVHFDVASNANGLQFSNTAFDVYQYGNQLNVFRNGILIDPAKILLLSANTIQINECLFAGDTVDVLNQGYGDMMAYSNANVANFLVSYSGNISGGYYLGNITQSQGYYSNANVANYLPIYSGNITSLTGNITTTANVSGLYILGNGSQLTNLADGANTTIQYNNAGNLDGIANWTFDRTKQTAQVQQILEKVTLSGNGIAGNVNYNVLDSAILYYNSTASANANVNFRGNSTTTLNSIIDVGQSLTVTLVADVGNTTYNISNYTIDGTTVYPRWLNGVANVNPSASVPTSSYSYTFNILKSAANTYRVLGTQARYS